MGSTASWSLERLDSTVRVEKVESDVNMAKLAFCSNENLRFDEMFQLFPARRQHLQEFSDCVAQSRQASRIMTIAKVSSSQ